MIPVSNSVRTDLPWAAHHTADRPSRTFYRPELDLLRAAAFLLIFLHHALHRQGLIPPPSSPYNAVISSIANACGFGLSLFFTFTGYLMTDLLMRERAAEGRVEISAFYMRRVLRIWPLYFLGLGIGIALALTKAHPDISVSATMQRYASYAVLAGNWYCAAHVADAGKSPMEILWSISIQEQFYLFWSLLFWTRFFRPAPAATKTNRFLLIASATLLVTSMVTLVVLANAHASTEQAWFNSFVEFGMFGAGAMLSLTLHGTAPRWGTSARVALAVCALVLWFAACFFFHIRETDYPISAFSMIMGYLAVEVGCVLLLLAALGISPAMQLRPLVYLGRISFGLYVFHELALNIAQHLLRRFQIAQLHLLQPVLGLGLTIALASTSYKFYEKPFLQLKKRLEIVKTRGGACSRLTVIVGKSHR